MTTPAAVTLRGGTAISVEPGQLADYAGRLDSLVRLLEREVLGLLLRLNGCPSLLPAAALDPAGAAQLIELSACCLALAGAALVSCLSLVAGLRAAVASYREVDRLADRAQPLGRAVGQLPGALRQLRRGHLQQALIADPGLAGLGTQSLTVLATGPLPALLPDTGLVVAGALGLAYPAGRPVVTAQPGAVTADARGAPRTTADLLRGLAIRDRYDDGGGAIDIRLLDGPGGRRAIVDITGTSRWNLNPLIWTDQATDFGTNLRALANESSVMTRGVRLALRQAGVGPDEPIMLVGHSQGGMVAARLADELNRSGEFRVSHLVTAGSPIGLAPVPDSVSVLSLENRGDPVPELDGADNPARPSWLTVGIAQRSAGIDSIPNRHSVNSYLAGAVELDRSHDQAVQHWRSGAADFLDARTVHTQVFQIRRG